MNYNLMPPLPEELLTQLNKKLCKLCHYALALLEPNKELSPVKYPVVRSTNPEAFVMAHPSKPHEANLCYLCAKKQLGLFSFAGEGGRNGEPKPITAQPIH